MEISQLSTDLKNNIDMYESYHFKLFLETDLEETMGMLIEIFNEEWGFPLEMNDTNPLFYSSVTSTILIALHHINLLDSDFKNKIYDVLFRLQNDTPNPTVKNKQDEDSPAWDISESANCYSTALALQALLETNYEGNRKDDIKNALIWLSKQRNPDGGWGFDNKCLSRVFFSAHVIHALDLGKKLFENGDENKRQIQTSIEAGLVFIKKEMHEDGRKFVYWSNSSNESTPDPTNTLYALWILQKHKCLDKEIKRRAINFLRNKVNSDGIFNFVKIVEEMNSKYAVQKAIVTFSPSTPLILLELGISPFDDLCLKHIMWLRNNYNDGWSLPGYNSNNISFTYALGIWTLIEWQKHSNKYIICNKLNNNCFTLLKRRINSLLIVSGFLIVYILKNPLIYLSTQLSNLLKEVNTFYEIIGFIAALITILTFLIASIKYVPRLIPYVDKENKIKNLWSRIKKSVPNLVYGCS